MGGHIGQRRGQDEGAELLVALSFERMNSLGRLIESAHTGSQHHAYPVTIDHGDGQSGVFKGIVTRTNAQLGTAGHPARFLAVDVDGGIEI